MPDDILSPYLQSGNIPAPGAEQARVIEQLRGMMESNDPEARAVAQQFFERFGSRPLGVGAHFATGGLSDEAMTSGHPLLRYGNQQLFPLPIYKPGELPFARQLSEQLTPIQDKIAKGVGVMAGGGGTLRLLRYLQSLRGGGPQPPAPLSPAGGGSGPQTLPPGGPSTPASPPEGPFGPQPPPPRPPEGPFGPRIDPTPEELPPFRWPKQGALVPPMTATGLLPEARDPGEDDNLFSAPLGFGPPRLGGGLRYPPPATLSGLAPSPSQARHPAGAQNRKGEKIGGQYRRDDD
jgi:hypothetical protein